MTFAHRKKEIFFKHLSKALALFMLAQNFNMLAYATDPLLDPQGQMPAVAAGSSSTTAVQTQIPNPNIPEGEEALSAATDLVEVKIQEVKTPKIGMTGQIKITFPDMDPSRPGSLSATGITLADTNGVSTRIHYAVYEKTTPEMMFDRQLYYNKTQVYSTDKMGLSLNVSGLFYRGKSYYIEIKAIQYDANGKTIAHGSFQTDLITVPSNAPQEGISKAVNSRSLNVKGNAAQTISSNHFSVGNVFFEGTQNQTTDVLIEVWERGATTLKRVLSKTMTVSSDLTPINFEVFGLKPETQYYWKIVGSQTLNGQTSRYSEYVSPLITTLELAATSVPVIKDIQPPTAKVGMDYSFQAEAIGGEGSYTWSIASAELAKLTAIGLTFSNGLISGRPSVEASFSLTISVKDALNQTAEKTLAFTSVLPFAVVGTIPDAVVGISYQYAFTVQGGTPYSGGTYLWIVRGGLPALQELGLNFVNGVVSGIPQKTGTAVIEVEVRDAKGQILSAFLTIQVVPKNLTIPSVTLPGAKVGQAFNFKLTADGGVGPYAWTLTSGATEFTHAGFQFGNDGTILGAPSTHGPLEFGVQVTDSLGKIAVLNLAMNVSPADLVISPLPPRTLRAGSVYQDQLTASGGVGPYTWSLDGNGAAALAEFGLSLDSATGMISGTLIKEGVLDVIFRVTDQLGVSASARFNQTIYPGVMPLKLNIPDNGIIKLKTGSIADIKIRPEGGDSSAGYQWKINLPVTPPQLADFNLLFNLNGVILHQPRPITEGIDILSWIQQVGPVPVTRAGWYEFDLEITSGTQVIKKTIRLEIENPNNDLRGAVIAPVVFPSSASNGVTLKWTTDETAMTWVEYGTTQNLGERTHYSQYATQHSVWIGGLEPNTQYFYRIHSQDNDANKTVTETRSFRTGADPLGAYLNSLLNSGLKPSNRFIAKDDAATVVQGRDVNIAIFNNDEGLDPRTDATNLTIYSMRRTIVPVTQPAHGTLTVMGAAVNYIPNPVYAGQDQFAYKFCGTDYRGRLDMNNCSNTAAVNLNVKAKPAEEPLEVRLIPELYSTGTYPWASASGIIQAPALTVAVEVKNYDKNRDGKLWVYAVPKNNLSPWPESDWPAQVQIVKKDGIYFATFYPVNTTATGDYEIVAQIADSDRNYGDNVSFARAAGGFKAKTEDAPFRISLANEKMPRNPDGSMDFYFEVRNTLPYIQRQGVVDPSGFFLNFTVRKPGETLRQNLFGSNGLRITGDGFYKVKVPSSILGSVNPGLDLIFESGLFLPALDTTGLPDYMVERIPVKIGVPPIPIPVTPLLVEHDGYVFSMKANVTASTSVDTLNAKLRIYNRSQLVLEVSATRKGSGQIEFMIPLPFTEMASSFEYQIEVTEPRTGRVGLTPLASLKASAVYKAVTPVFQAHGYTVKTIVRGTLPGFKPGRGYSANLVVRYKNGTTQTVRLTVAADGTFMYQIPGSAVNIGTVGLIVNWDASGKTLFQGGNIPVIWDPYYGSKPIVIASTLK